MTQDEIKYITKDLPTSFYENKEGLYKDEDGNFYDGNGKIIDKDRGIINKVKAQGAVLDKQNKGKFKVTQETEGKPQHEGTGGWRKRATNKNK